MQQNILTIVLLSQITRAAETEEITSQKLVKGHAYSITGAEEVKKKQEREVYSRPFLATDCSSI